MKLPCDDRAPAAGRQVVEDLGPITDQPDRLMEAQLVVSELVANAVEHGCEPIGLKLVGSSWRMRIEVSDGSNDPPMPSSSPGVERLSGRGLVIVDALAAAWGSRSCDGGKVVWAELSWSYPPDGNSDGEHDRDDNDGGGNR